MPAKDEAALVVEAAEMRRRSTVEMAWVALALAGVRYDDTWAGPGVNITAGIDLPFETPLTLRLGSVAIPHVELSGEVGLAQNGVFAYSGSPAPLLPILNDSGPASRGTWEDQVSSTALLGLRVSYP